MLFEHEGKSNSVFHRHASALSKVLQHWVCCIAEQCDTVVHPLVDRIPVAENPKLPVLAMADNGLSLVVDMAETAHNLLEFNRQPGDRDRKSVVTGKRVSVRGDRGGRRIIKKKKNN